MAALFQFPSEALIAAITSRRASEENAPSVFVSSQMCTPSDKLLTAAFSPNMMVIRQRVFSTATALASAPVERFQMRTKTSAFLRRMEGVCVCVCVCVCVRVCASVCVCCVWRTVNMIHRRGLIKSLPQCGREGERASLRRSKKNYRAAEVSPLLCDERLECSLFFYGCLRARSLHGWLVQYTCEE